MTSLAVRDPSEWITTALEAKADPDRLGQLFDLHKQWLAIKAAEAFADALTGFQAECPAVEKERRVVVKGTERYKFASYEDIMFVVKPLLAKYKIAHSVSTPEPPEGKFITIVHLRVGSHAEERKFVCGQPNILELAKATFCNEAQAWGVWRAYMKRYAFTDALGIVVKDEDTDAAGLDKFIDLKQIEKINTLLEESGVSLDAFRRRHEVESLEVLPLARFDLAVDELQRKIRQNKSKQETAK